MRKLGYPGIDLSAAAAPRGAKPLTKYGALWENHSFAADLRAVPPPDEEFETTFLGGEYGALEGLIPLDHREPARWRFETLTALWPAAELAGLQDATKLVAVIVRPSGGARFAVLAALREWIDPPVAELDVWLDPAKITKAPEIVRAYRIAAEVARKLGTERAETFAPPHAAKPIKSLGF
ncbi:MAG: hypothetical protein E6K18_05370 [Methanobacteriota archaeon]|nr:MAG: hypothetical protein E6K18_05370 [Euryarchaeota archaeon]